MPDETVPAQVMTQNSPPPNGVSVRDPPERLRICPALLIRAHAQLRYERHTQEGIRWIAFVLQFVVPLFETDKPRIEVARGSDLAEVAVDLVRIFRRRYPDAVAARLQDEESGYLLGVLAFPAPDEVEPDHASSDLFRRTALYRTVKATLAGLNVAPAVSPVEIEEID